MGDANGLPSIDSELAGARRASFIVTKPLYYRINGSPDLGKIA